MSEAAPQSLVNVSRCEYIGAAARRDRDRVLCEVPVALVYNGVSHVVMMMTPVDLRDFALGFSLSEGILEHAGQLLDLELATRSQGLELRLQIPSRCFARLKARRRNLAGRTGCGLCGAESLAQAMPPPARVTTRWSVAAPAVCDAMARLQAQQPLRQESGAAHGAAFVRGDGDLLLVREDVGRHNALDKVLGAMALAALEPEGMLLVSSRASYEMVAKAASANVPLLAAASAPTSLAIERAQASGLTLMAFVDEQRCVVYTHPQRLAALA